MGGGELRSPASHYTLTIEVKLLLSANRKAYNVESIGATTDDLE